MEQLPRLRARIGALGDFHELIRALEALAATQFRAAQDALRVSKIHLEVVEQAVRSVAIDRNPWTTRAPGLSKPVSVTIAICSEHGFVGAFNERILDRLETEAREGDHLILLGRRGAQVALERSIRTAQDLPMAAHANSVPGLARQLSIATDWADRIQVVYSCHQIGERFSVDCKTIEPGLFAANTGPSNLDRPLRHLALERLREGLHRDLVFATVAHCLLEGLASENATRLASMQSADGNVRDKLNELTSRERTVRQQEITEELLDILTGVEAVLE